MDDTEKLIVTRKQTAEMIGFSPSQVLKFEREGLLTPIRLPGLRSVRYARAEVEALARRWIEASKQQHEAIA